MTAKRFAIIGNYAPSLINFRGPLIEDILARGHEVFALGPDIDAATAQALRALGAKHVEISLSRAGLNPLADLGTMLSLYRTLARIKPDVVLSFGIKPIIYGTFAARLIGVPRRFVLIAGLGYAFIENGRASVQKTVIHYVARWFYRLALPQADRVFVQNPDDADDLVRLGISSREKIVRVNGTGVDLEVWKPAPPVLSPVTFTFIGRLLRDKGVLEFVEAARKVKAAHPHTRFLLVGGLDDNPESIRKEDVEGWVQEGILEWPGHVPVQPFLEQTSVFVLPSYREGVPRSTQEAMAMARPVITTDSVGCRETVVEGRNGFLVPPRDPEAIAGGMRKFIASPDLIASMGAESRKLAEERFDVRKVNAAMIEAMGL